MKRYKNNLVIYMLLRYNYFIKGDEFMQIIYHGSYCEVKTPKVMEGKYQKDFGTGFYCTLLEEQAIRWAKKYETSIVNCYEYNQDENLKIKEFTIMTEEWLDFIINCRLGNKHDYDIVIGAMADDQVYNYVTDLINNRITRKAFWELAKFRHPTHQIAFCTEKSLDCIRFIESRSV